MRRGAAAGNGDAQVNIVMAARRFAEYDRNGFRQLRIIYCRAQAWLVANRAQERAGISGKFAALARPAEGFLRQIDLTDLGQARQYFLTGGPSSAVLDHTPQQQIAMLCQIGAQGFAVAEKGT